MSKVRKLSSSELHHLVKLAAGLLQETNGDVRQAMSRAMEKHFALLATIRDQGISADLGPGDVVLHVPDEGGMALRMVRHTPQTTDERAPTEEADYPEIDLLGFEVVETDNTPGSHQSEPRMDAGHFDIDWTD